MIVELQRRCGKEAAQRLFGAFDILLDNGLFGHGRCPSSSLRPRYDTGGAAKESPVAPFPVRLCKGFLKRIRRSVPR
jgi:hypothetical protein